MLGCDSQDALIFQNSATGNERLVKQLLSKKIDAAQYIGADLMVKEWGKIEHNTPIIKEFSVLADLNKSFCLIDFGTGTGRNCAQIVNNVVGIKQIILIDVSEAMLLQAKQYVEEITKKSIIGIVADFVLDKNKIVELINKNLDPKIFLNLGFTFGNYNSKKMFDLLDKFTQKNDVWLIELGTYTETNRDEQLNIEAGFYRSRRNCEFGLQWLSALGNKICYDSVFTTISQDALFPEIWVVKGFYKIPHDFVVKIANKDIKFKKGEVFQFVESRRYNQKYLIDYFNVHGYNAISQTDFSKKSFILIEKGQK